MTSKSVPAHLDTMLLAILAAGPLHGYAVITELRTRSEGAFDLPEGTVYPALHRLQRARLLSSTWTTVEGRRRRIYTLTAAGARALDEQRSEWQRFAVAVHAVLGVST